jgi:hypothetical protein
MPGGSRFELKWDGFRAGAVCRGSEVRLWSRNYKDFTTKFPDVQKALASQVDVDCVLDGELVVWNGDRLDFDALQQRMVNTATTVRARLVPAKPASFVVFDVLAVDNVDIRPMRWTARRGRLESLAKNWRPPLQVSPATDDPDEAREWLAAFKSSGIEGLVVKGPQAGITRAAVTGSRSILSGSRCSTSSPVGHTTRSAAVRVEHDCERHLSDTLRTAVCCDAARLSWVVAMAASKSAGDRGTRCRDP